MSDDQNNETKNVSQDKKFKIGIRAITEANAVLKNFSPDPEPSEE